MGINQIRLEILAKGFANKTDIAKFIPCGSRKASEIYNEIYDSVKADGKIAHPLGISPKRLLKRLNIKEADVIKYAKTEIEIEILQQKKSLPAKTATDIKNHPYYKGN